MLAGMRYFLFVVVMLLSIRGVRALDWPGWVQVTVLLAVNLLVGALLFAERDQGEPDQPQPR